jgi:hypothetical protein
LVSLATARLFTAPRYGENKATTTLLRKSFIQASMGVDVYGVQLPVRDMRVASNWILLILEIGANGLLIALTVVGILQKIRSSKSKMLVCVMTACVTVEVIADISMRYWNHATPAVAWIKTFYIGLITAMLVSTY